MINFHRYIIFLILLAISYSGFPQTSITSPNKYFLFKHYTTQNGLLNNDIYAMGQDRNGYIYIATELGLTRFDGKTFYHKTIPEVYENTTPVNHFAKTKEGNIIATGWMHGVFVQQNDGRFKYYSARFNTWSTLSYCLDGTILVASSDVLYLLTPDSLQQIYDHGTGGLFKTIDVDKEQRIWFGSERFGLGLLQPSGEGYELVFLPEFKDKAIRFILFDEEQTLHVATHQGYYRIKWKQPEYWNTYTIEQPFPQLKDIEINRISFDNERNFWIPTSSYGVFRTKGNTITLHLTKETGIISSDVECVIQDKEGNYWFGTNKGISMIDNFDNYAITKNGVRFNEANRMVLDEYNRIWLSGRSTLHIYEDEKIIPINLNGTPIEKEGVWFVNTYNSELIVASNIGLYKMPITKALPDLRKLRKIADFKNNNVTSVYLMVTDSAGIWIYTLTNMYNYREGRFVQVTFKPDSILRKPCLMIPDKYGYYWFGDNLTGLYRGILSRPDHHTLLFESIKDYKTNKPDFSYLENGDYKSNQTDSSFFETKWIDWMCFDKEDYLWLSAAVTGVYKFTINENGVVSYKLYTKADGLSGDLVKKIDFDDEGRVWFSIPKNGINILQCDSKGVERIDRLDVQGMGGMYRPPLQIGNRLYLLTDEGVFITSNQWFKIKSGKAPKVFITNLLLNGVADPEISAHTNNIRLAHSQNNITIEYSAIVFRNADEIMYQYKLEGADKEWSVLSDRGSVEYAALQPGKYTFKVRTAMLGAETEIGEETSLTFRIAPAFYQAVWFYSLIIIVIAALLYVFYRYRIKYVIKMERMRARIASDLHDDIGSTLSSISMISEMAVRQDKESALAKSLSKIGESSRDVLNSMDDIIWSVNPQNDTLLSLFVRLREYAIPICESKNITLNINVDEETEPHKLGMDARRNIFLIVKEAINNASKHSKCETISVTFTLKPEILISIQDDGCGFDPTVSTLRNGLANMEQRAQQIGAEFNITSKKNAGTLIFLKFRNHIII